jgi:hypothetical protein
MDNLPSFVFSVVVSGRTVLVRVLVRGNDVGILRLSVRDAVYLLNALSTADKWLDLAVVKCRKVHHHFFQVIFETVGDRETLSRLYVEEVGNATEKV